MEIRELKSKEEMLSAYEILLEVYPNLTMEEYSHELDIMMPHNYGQMVVMVFDHMEQWAKEQKCTMLALDSYTTNFKAHRFFYGQGYGPKGFHFVNILDKSKVR